MKNEAMNLKENRRGIWEIMEGDREERNRAITISK